jgi:hypothetical protein
MTLAMDVIRSEISISSLTGHSTVRIKLIAASVAREIPARGATTLVSRVSNSPHVDRKGTWDVLPVGVRAIRERVASLDNTTIVGASISGIAICPVGSNRNRCRSGGRVATTAVVLRIAVDAD